MKPPKRLLAGLLFALVLHFAASAFAADKPNFIVINIDDMGYADIGPYGSKLNRTPNLNRLAEEGMKLTCFYAAPVCSPSRASLMTGCYPKRALPTPHVLFPSAEIGLSRETPTVAELLKQAGYATACVGKWHLGDQPPFLPTRRGFDYYLGIPYSNDMGPIADGAKSNLGAPLPKPRANRNLQQKDLESGIRGMAQPPMPLLENEQVVARVRQDQQQGIVERYTTAAVKFIKDNKDRPFFLYLPHSAVHFPIFPGKRWAGNSPHGIYSDWVEEVDWSVGQVMKAVRGLNLDKNTLVLFTSDNGGTSRGVNAPLRGFKGSTWEGGMREPTIAWWPGRIPAGSENGEVCGMMDILPTFVKLAGGKVPAADRLDGADIWPLMAGEPGAKTPHEVFHYFRGFKLEAIRQGPWKLHLVNRAPAPKKGKQKKGGKKVEPQFPLYNLDTDIGEKKDVAAAHPDIVKRLRELAAKMDADLGTDGVGPGCRPLARVKKAQPLIGHDGKIRAGFER